MRKLAMFTGAFAGGVALAQYVLPYTWLLTAEAAALLLTCSALLLPGGWRKRGVLAGVGLSLALGWNWLYVRQAVLPMRDLEDTRQIVELTVCDYPETTSFGIRVPVWVRGIPVGKAAYYTDTEEQLYPGQVIVDEVQVRSAVTGEHAGSLASKGIFWTMISKGTPSYFPGNPNALRWIPVRLGQTLRERIRLLYDGDAAAVLCAMLTGDRSEVSDTVLAELSETGLRHVLAVSGMHVMFLLQTVTLSVGLHRKRLLAAVTIPLLAGYAVLTGGSPSVTRACLMAVCLLAAPLFRRESDSPTALAMALFLILLHNPFAVQSVSLQLSFGSMAGILWLSGPLYRLMQGDASHGALFRYVTGSVSVSIGALVFTAPLSLWYFGMFSLLSPLSSLLCLWAVEWMFLLGLGSLALSWVWMPLGALAAGVSQLFLTYFLAAAHLLSRLPHRGLYRSNGYAVAALAMTYLLFVIARLGKGTRRTYGLAAALSILLLGCSPRLWYAQFQDGALHLLALDVGQGQSLVLSDNDRYALVDCGSDNSWYAAGDLAVTCLRGRGCQTLDYLVLTHFDADHVNGVVTLLARMPVDTLLVPDYEENLFRTEILQAAARYGVTVRTVTEAGTYPLGGSVLTVYPPGSDKSGNDGGLSLLCSRGALDALMTGDMDSAGERRLLETEELPDIEVLVAGHHGSKTSSSMELLETVQPEIALVSVGENSYGHPTPEAMRRLRKVGADIYRTDLQGTIDVKLRN